MNLRKSTSLCVDHACLSLPLHQQKKNTLSKWWLSASLPLLLSLSALSLPHISMANAMVADYSSMVEQVTPSIVRVNVTKKLSQQEMLQQQLPELLERFFGPGFRYQQPERTPTEPRSYGTAFFISADGFLLTNHHVIEDARKVTITFADRRELDAEVIGSDERTDVAVLKVKGSNFPALNMGDSNKLKVGEPVLAIGSPFGFDFSASSGIVSAKSRSMNNESTVPFIQTDVALNPGNSGGPLFNRMGEVVGINSRIFSGTGGYMGLSFSIPIDVALEVADQLKNGGKVNRAYLGVYPQDLDRNLAEAYGLTKPDGALVTKVIPNSAASAAGIKENDIILSFNNKPITRSADLISEINRVRPNTTVPLTLRRNGQDLTLQASLKAAPEDKADESKDKTNALEKTPILGLQARDLTAEEKQQIEVTGGVLITRIAAGGSAQRSGLLVGDVVTHINRKAVNTIDDFIKTIKPLKTGEVVPVRLIRRGSPLIMGLRLEADDTP